MKLHTQKEHLAHYIPLAVILGIGLVVALGLSFERQLQITTLVAVACFYVAWGIIHHYLHHTLTAKIVLEYVLVAILGMTAIVFLMQHPL